MRAFIHCDSTGYPCNTNAFTAFVGLREMGYECIFFQRYEELMANNHCKEEVIVSGIGMIRRRLQDFGIGSNGINYPEELGKYLGRRIWKLTINEITQESELKTIIIWYAEQLYSFAPNARKSFWRRT